jgi:hypothetical protein
LVEAKLKENNIALFPIPKDRLVATWIDPDKPKSIKTPKLTSYQKRLEMRKRRVEENNRKQKEAQQPLPHVQK